MSTLGLKIPTVGPQTLDPGLAVMASEAEAAGASSVWVSDHIVMTEQTESHYPYATGGKVTWQADARVLCDACRKEGWKEAVDALEGLCASFKRFKESLPQKLPSTDQGDDGQQQEQDELEDEHRHLQPGGDLNPAIAEVGE